MDHKNKKYIPKPGAKFTKREKLPNKIDTSTNAIVFGTHAVHEAWLNPDREIKHLYITERALEGFQKTIDEAKALGIKRPGPEIYIKPALDKMTNGGVHQGVAISADHLLEISAQDLVTLAYKKESATILLLDQITDPHNIGAILRSAAAFGADGIIMQTKHAPLLTGVLAKTASGAVEHVPVAYETNLSRALGVLQDAGYTGLAMDEHADNSFADAQIPMKVVVCLGAEGKGLRPKIKEQCEIHLRLPTQGSIQSLNVSNAAAIALFAINGLTTD